MKYALVTGGTRGIGGAITRTLARDGYFVIATGVGEAEVEQFEPVPNVRAAQLDVTSSNEVDALLGSIGQLDALVNCAGIIQRNGKEFEVEGFTRTIEVNLIGTMRVCLAARAKLSSGGSIVNAASMLSFFGSAHAPGYSASKGGVAQLTKSLAAAWAPDGIRVNAVAPGWIETELTRPLGENTARSAAIIERTPMGRWGNAAEIADVVGFLLSEKARFVTGAIIPVDGGYASV
jgi:NAD(P)-dependent dehydrogenase (short-subunit alcohol dehydrogenase family)